MNTVIQSRRSSALIDFSRLLRAISTGIQAWRRRRACRSQLARLDDYLRRDIGLLDPGMTRAEHRQRPGGARQVFSREHEIRFKIWS
jgi:uncharacterized protein YjiS (DUF1127 family)